MFVKGETFKCRIKRGTAIFHDHGFFRWPECKAPGGKWIADDPDMEFDCSQFGQDNFDLTAPGYGVLGMKGQYGNGGICVKSLEGLIIANSDRDRIVASAVRHRLSRIAGLETEIEKLRTEIAALSPSRLTA